MAAAMQRCSGSVASCSRQSSVVPGVRGPAAVSRRHVARVAEPGGAATLPVPAGDQGGAAAAVAEPFAVSGRRKPYVPLTPEDLCSTPVPADKMSLPQGYHWYETMIVVRPNVTDQERDELLAKFEAYLAKEECLHINALVRPRSRLAYPMKRQWDGMYVLYTYAARRQTARAVQLHLSNPEAGREDDVLRHITFCRM